VRAPLAKLVRKDFGIRLKSVAPHFSEAKGENIPPGDRLFVWEVAPTLRFYLLLQIHQHEDWFTIEVGISRTGRWPAYALTPVEPDRHAQGDSRFRLGRLWAPPQRDLWWELAPRPPSGASFEAYANRTPVESLLSNVNPLVEDAVRRFEEYGMPWLRRVAIEAGHPIE
jgi:hypothetical protein